MFIKKLGLIILLVICSVSCNSEANIQPKSFLQKTVDFVIKNKDDKYIELPNLYDSLVSRFPKDSLETMKIAEILKSKGFVVTNWGRGNFPPKGARIVSLDLEKDDCICKVDKIYYYSISEEYLEIAERISCKSKK